MRILMVFHAPPYPPDIGPSRRNYHVLAETVKRHDVTVLSLGSRSDRTAFIERFGAVCARAVFVPNQYGAAIKEFAAMIELADLVVTADSLALHIATALSRPAVVFVGPTSPWELDLYGRGEVVSADVPCLACYRRECDQAVTCMERLAPETVYAASLRVRAAGSAGHFVSEMTRIDA